MTTLERRLLDLCPEEVILLVAVELVDGLLRDAVLLAKLSGYKNAPKGRSALQQCQVENGDMLRALYVQTWNHELLAGKKQVGDKQTAPWRLGVVRTEWDKKLSQTQQDAYAQSAKDEAAAARAARPMAI